ncbi:IST1 homolog isoform X2 [Varroa jacobsoni]|nr:IST1 homolog isoform X2 [Varroa jacobsoni]
MELIEMYCDLILTRFGLVKECQTLDSGLQESVSSIIWAGPRIATDVPEIKMVCDQLCKKYGELYVKGVRERSIGTVNAKLMHRLSAEPPSRNLVERYLKEIATTHDLSYEPQIVDDDDHQKGGGVGNLIDIGPIAPDPSTAVGFRPDLLDPSSTPKPTVMAPAFEPPMLEVQTPSSANGLYDLPSASTLAVSGDQSVSSSEAVPKKKDTTFRSYEEDIPPPTYDAVTTIGRKNTSEFPPDVSTLDLPEIPHLPDVPRSDTGTPQSDNWGTSTSGNDVDFDELSRRFEELKKRK